MSWYWGGRCSRNIMFLFGFSSWPFVVLRAPSWISFVLPAPSWIENGYPAAVTMSLTTLPPTSVSRKSRPLWRKVSLVWSRPS